MNANRSGTVISIGCRHQGDRLLLVEAMSGTVDLEIRGD